MKCEFTLHIGERTEIITDGDLDHYADEAGLNAAKHRCTWVFLMDLLLHERFLGVETWGIAEEIRALEQGRYASGTKPASQFQQEPLRGLWHKHYFCAAFVAKNMLNQLTHRRIEAVVRATLRTSPSGVFADQTATQLAHRLTVDQIEERERAGKLTGEWIIFAKHGGHNYYLCLATHDAGDQAIFDRIKGTCFPQFPFLATES